MRVRVLRLNDMLQPTEPIAADTACAEDTKRESEDVSDSGCGLSMYRDRTILLLRRYLRLSLEAGRLPSLLGREFFRTRVTAYRTHTFEDLVIFVHDIERSLEELEGADQQLIAAIVLQEHSQDEAAYLLGYTRRTVVRRYAEALDRVSKIFLQKHIMEHLAVSYRPTRNCCQEGENADLPANHSECGKYKQDYSLDTNGTMILP